MFEVIVRPWVAGGGYMYDETADWIPEVMTAREWWTSQTYADMWIPGDADAAEVVIRDEDGTVIDTYFFEREV